MSVPILKLFTNRWVPADTADFRDVFDCFCGNPRDLREYIYRSINRKNFPADIADLR